MGVNAIDVVDYVNYLWAFNEALIYYSQIQNEVKGDLLAQEARFKVAKTSYFKGDFKIDDGRKICFDSASF